MDRQHRHDLKHDKFVDEIGALSVRAKANQRLLLTIGLGAIVLAAAVYGYLFYTHGKEEKAQLALSSAIETVEAQVGDNPQGQSDLQTAPKFKTVTDRDAAAEKQFKAVQSQYSGTVAADIAGLFLARMAVARGDNASAQKGLQAFIDDHGDHPLLGASARYSLYQLRIENGQAAQVTTELNAELAKAESVLPGDALLILLAQAYDVQGNSAKAKEAYRRITTEFPDSDYAVEAARRGGAA